MLSSIQIAEICHEANRAYCRTIGDKSQVSWKRAPKWQKRSATSGVEYHIAHPNSKPHDSHNNWLKEKRDAGWKYGPIKDSVKKEHPCFIPYNELSDEQKLKDSLFLAIVRTFRH